MPQLRVVAQLTTKPDSTEVVREALTTLESATQNPPGCVEFVMDESVAAPGTFLTVETWESQETGDAHMATEDLATAIFATEGHLAGDIAIHPLRHA